MVSLRIPTSADALALPLNVGSGRRVLTHEYDGEVRRAYAAVRSPLRHGLFDFCADLGGQELCRR